MKFMILSGTPKKEGQCYDLVTTAIETVSEVGVEAEVVHLSDLKIDHCHMCGDGWGICFNDHRCYIGDHDPEDAFNDIHKKTGEVDGFIYITPVYMYEMSDVMKRFLDRLRRCEASKRWGTPGVSTMADKPSIIVASAGGVGGGTVATFVAMEEYINTMGGAGRPRNTKGIFENIGVTRWNIDYQQASLKAAIKALVANMRGEVTLPPPR